MTTQSSDRPTYHTTKLYRVAVVWYANEEQWARMKAVASDPGSFEGSYAAWTGVFEASLAKLERDDRLPIRTSLDADDFVAWCDARGCARDGASRSLFAAEIMRQAEQS